MIKIFSKFHKKKFFYISKQRCGTKSFGDFFRKNNYKIFSWPETRDSDINNLYWSGRWVDILNSDYIRNYDVFEDKHVLNLISLFEVDIPDDIYYYIRMSQEFTLIMSKKFYILKNECTS